MNYSKPKVMIMGNAKSVIEVISTKAGTPHDHFRQMLSGPAYDLDE
jgi:hypothetical protein